MIVHTGSNGDPSVRGTEQRRRRRQAEPTTAAAAETAKSEFLANMSHELRTPLNAIIGFSDILRREMFGPLGDPRYRDYAHNVQDSAARLLQVIEDLLDLAQIEAGRMQVRDSDCDLAALVETVAEGLAPEAAAAEVALVTRLPPGLPRLRVDEERVTQLLGTLVGEAISLSPPGAEVVVSARYGAAGLSLVVTDRSTAVPRDPRRQRVAPFAPGTTAYIRRRDGTGLGLPLARALMALHEGNLELRNRSDRGAAILLHFPPHRLIR